jgi:peptide/nickel transport system ATP-binding protein
MSCLLIQNLSVRFATDLGTLTAVDNVSLEHEARETLALVGETGCGKSVLAGAILKLLPEDAELSGVALYDGRNLLSLPEKALSRIRGNEISLVLQNPSLSLNPVHTVGKQISEVFLVHRKSKLKNAMEQTLQLLRRMGFARPERVAALYPFQLSEGMNQRVLIAMAVALQPKIIIADEPTKGLDESLKEDIIQEINRIKEVKGFCLILITHDLDVARKLSDRIAIMYCGQILELSPKKVFFDNPLHPYSLALLESLPERGFKPIPGMTPSMVAPPRGCRFHPRCEQRMAICQEKDPEFYKKGGISVKCFLYR